MVVPDANTSWYGEARAYRRGVALDGHQGLVGNEFSWLKVWVDLPGVMLTLDRRRLVVESPNELRSEVTELLDSMFLRELLGHILREASSSWWVRHRRNLLCLLDKIIGRAHLDSSSREILREQLHFTSEIGSLTIRELQEHAPREALDMSFEGEYERRVFTHLINGMALGARASRPGDSHLDEEHERGTARLVRLVNDALAGMGITLRVATRFGGDWELARWEKRPYWAGSQTASSAALDLHALREQTLRTRHATLLLNPRCVSLRLLGTQLEQADARLAGLLLAEWATAFVTHDRRRMDRFRAALFQLVGEEHPPPHEGEDARCFVAYDWTFARGEFSAVQRAMSAPPFNLKVLDASHESRGRFFLSNILEMMKSCQVIVSIYTQRLREDGTFGVNSNVLIEGGMAEALRSRRTWASAT